MQKSNFDIIMDNYIQSFPDDLKDNGIKMKNLIRNYISKTGFTIKFLNSCSTGFAGVRTRNQIIICKPWAHIGDFIYTLFHEIRHEIQIGQLKLLNPITDFDLDDFESLYEAYWEMELDADRFAKEMVARLVIKCNFPMDFAKEKFRLSPYIENYPSMSNQVKSSLEIIIRTIRDMKKQGLEFSDLQDLPMIQKHLTNLENLI